MPRGGAQSEAIYGDPGPDPFILPTSPSKNNDDDNDRLQGIELLDRLRDAKVNKDFNGIGHQFISALGAIAFGTPPHDIDDIKEYEATYISGQSFKR